MTQSAYALHGLESRSDRQRYAWHLDQEMSYMVDRSCSAELA